MIVGCKQSKVDAYGNEIEPGSRIPIYDDSEYQKIEIDAVGKKINRGMGLGGTALPMVVSEVGSEYDMEPWKGQKRRGPKNKFGRKMKQAMGMSPKKIEVMVGGGSGLGGIDEIMNIVNEISAYQKG